MKSSMSRDGVGCRIMEPVFVAKEFTKESGANDVYVFLKIPYFSL